jgi:transposase
MLHVGLDLSRKRVDVHVMSDAGETVDVWAVLPDSDGLRALARRLEKHGEPVLPTGVRSPQPALHRYLIDI